MLKASQNLAEKPTSSPESNEEEKEIAPGQRMQDFSWPFKKLRDNDFCDYKHFIKQLASDPEVVIRRENYFYDNKIHKSRGEVPLSEKIAHHRLAKEKLRELQTKYNIPIPRFQYVVGHDDEHDNPAVYTVTEKIHGDDLESTLSKMKEKEERKKLEALFLSLIAYMRDTYCHGGKFFWDIFNAGQYKYGIKRNEKEKRIYLVDFEPWMADYHANNRNYPDNYSLYKDAENLKQFILSAEKETGAEFKEAYEQFNDFLDNISANDPDFGDYRRLRFFTESKNA